MDIVIAQLYKWMCPRGAIDSRLSARHCNGKPESGVSSTLLSRRIWTENALRLSSMGSSAREADRGGRMAPDCVPPFTPIPLSAQLRDLLKSSKHPSAFVWSDDLTGMPSCSQETEPKSTLAGITPRREDQGFVSSWTQRVLLGRKTS